MNIEVTHEMIIEDYKKIYFAEALNAGNIVNKDFIQIDNVELLKGNRINIKFVEVTGTIHFYGYKVENGGFYDIINNEYYDETILNNKVTIKRISATKDERTNEIKVRRRKKID